VLWQVCAVFLYVLSAILYPLAVILNNSRFGPDALITDPAIYILTYEGNNSMIEEWKSKTAGN
jgi:hypothetical protein